MQLYLIEQLKLLFIRKVTQQYLLHTESEEIIGCKIPDRSYKYCTKLGKVKPEFLFEQVQEKIVDCQPYQRDKYKTAIFKYYPVIVALESPQPV